jgi:hypothetical protein
MRTEEYVNKKWHIKKIWRIKKVLISKDFVGDIDLSSNQIVEFIQNFIGE